MFVTFTSGLNDALPVGPAGGDLSGTYPNPNARGLHETAGPTQLLYGAIPDQTFLQRVAGTVVGTDPNTTVKGPWSSVLYVDNVRGSDVTGVRGNDNLPFATIQAALNAMQQFDTVQLAPQAFPITVTLTIPATVINGTCLGSGANTLLSFSGAVGGTQLSSTTVGLWNFGANLGLSGFALANMDLFGSVATLSADGSSYAKDAFMAGGLYLLNVVCSGAGPLTTKYLRNFLMRGGNIPGAISHVNGGPVTYQGVYGSAPASSPAMTATYDAADALATTAVQTIQLIEGTVMGGVGSTGIVTLGGQCHLVVDQTSTIGGLKGSAAVPLAVNGAKVPSVLVQGYVGGQNSGVLDFASAGSELPDTATVLTWDFRGARLYLNNAALAVAAVFAVITAKFKVGGAAGNFQTVKLDGTTTVAACTFTADAKIHLTMRGADLVSPVYTTPGADGDIIPPMLTGTVDVSAGGAVAKTWVQLGYAGLIRTGAACDTAFVSESAAASDPFVSTKATTGLTITAAVVGGDTACNWMAVWK